MKDKKARQNEPPLFLDMPFEEALERFAQTKPEEVEPPRHKKAKVSKAAQRLSARQDAQSIAEKKSP